MKTVLVIDDEQEICETIQSRLSKVAKVSYSTALSEAVVQCHERRFDIIILDRGTLRRKIGAGDFSEFAKLSYRPNVICITGALDPHFGELQKGEADFFAKLISRVSA